MQATITWEDWHNSKGHEASSVNECLVATCLKRTTGDTWCVGVWSCHNRNNYDGNHRLPKSVERLIKRWMHLRVLGLTHIPLFGYLVVGQQVEF